MERGDYSQDVSRLVSFRLPILALVLLAGCGISLDSGAGPQPPPPNAVDLTFYMRDLSGLPHHYIFRGEHHPDTEGMVTDRAATIGCGPVGRDWELVVSQGLPPPDPADEVVLRITGEPFGDPDVLTLWLSVELDGTAVTGEGVPEWWGDRDLQGCS